MISLLLRLFVWVAGLLAGILGLAACGGGGDSQDDTSVSFYGDSLTAGAYGDAQGNEHFLAPTPVQKFSALTGRPARDYSRSGTTSVEALNGQAPAPFGPFAQQIQADPSPLVVLRYGGADAIKGVAAADTALALQSLVRLARAAGKRVVVTGISFIRPDNPSESLAHVAEFNNLVAQTARQEGVPFIDVRLVPFNGAADMADNLHPNQVYSDRITTFIAQQLR